MRNIESQAVEPRRARRRGFTLMELVIVILIILLISALILPSVLGALNERKFSEATRSLQAIFLGARDRAIQSGNIVGVRLIRDDTDPFEVTQLAYVTVPEPFAMGRVTVSGTTVTPVGAPQPDPHFEQVDPGKDATLGTFDDIPRVVPNFSSIRFDFSGRLYLITAVTIGTPSTLTISPAPVSVTAGTAHQYQIFGGPVPMAQADTIPLPEGLVIDLRTPALQLASSPGQPDRELLRLPRSLNIPNQIARGPQMPWGSNGVWGDGDDPATSAPPASWPPIDILFAPNGSVTGLGATTPLMHFWIGERGDKGGIGIDGQGGTVDDVRPNRPRRMVTLNTRTGLVVVGDDPTPVGTPNNYVEVYGPAEQSLGVSYLP